MRCEIFFELLHQRLHAAGPQAELLDQREHFSRRRMKRLRAAAFSSSRRVCLLVSTAKSRRCACIKCCKRRQVVRHAGQNLLLGEPLGERDLDRAIERQLAAVDALQTLDRGFAARRTTAACCGGNACG